MNTKCLQHKHKVTKALMFRLHTSFLNVLLFVGMCLMLISIFALQPSPSFQAFYKLHQNVHLMGSEH